MKEKSKWGGKRSGAGREKGSLNKATVEKKVAEKIFEDRVVKSVDRLFDSQMSLALGTSYLYRIDEVEEGKKIKKVHTLVTSSQEIKEYLDGDVEADSYYYITTEKPDSRSIDSLLDRTFGRAKQKIEIDSENKMMIIMDLKVSNPKFHELTTHPGSAEQMEAEEGEIIKIDTRGRET